MARRISFNKGNQQARDDAFSDAALTEDSTGVFLLDVLANDRGGAAKRLYSLDDGEQVGELRKADHSDQTATADRSALGARIWIADGGKVGYDPSSLGSTQSLAAGEVIEDSFVYAIQLGNGTLSWAKVTLTIAGRNDGPEILSVVGSGPVAEAPDNSPGEGAMLAVDGTIDFGDVDSSDTHSVAFSPQNDGYVGSFSAALADDSTGDGSGQVGWNFAVADAEIDSLAAGETRTQSYDVTVSDGHGGAVTQTVVVTITGTNDAPVITSGEQAGEVSEGDDGSSRSASGQVTFSDADLGDTHGFTTSGASHGEASVDENGNWIYTVADESAVDALPAGETLADEFSVTVDDGQGGTAAQTVAITITGTNDAPVIGGQTGGSVTEDGTTSASGTLVVDDPDTGESSFQAQSGIAGAYGTLNINAAGNWTYFLNNSLPSVQALNAGQTLADAVNVQTADGTLQAIDLTINGQNEAAAGFLGKQLSYQYLLPTISSPFLAPRGFTAGDGVEVPATPSSGNGYYAFNFNVDISATSLSVTYVGAVRWGMTSFNGFKITDSANNLRDIVGVSDTSAQVVTTFDANNIYVNWAGVQFVNGQTFTIDVTFGNSGNDPLVFDLGGDGIEFSDAVNFDLDADGHAEQTAWAGPRDGTLVMDLDGSGAIENGSEVLSEHFDSFGFGTSMEALRSLDTNVDGRVDAQDDRFARLQLWRDANADGLSQAEELLALDNLGITGISVREQTRDETVDGQHVYAAGSFTYADGASGAYFGVLLSAPSATGEDTGLFV